MDISRRGLLLASLLAGFASPAFARKPVPADLSEKDKADVARIGQYLNSITSFSGNFQQYSDQGGLVTGRIYMRRPGRLRVEYDPPVKILLIADGFAMNYYDAELDHLEQIPLQLSPMWFLLKKKIDLNEDVTVIGFDRAPNAFRLQLIQQDEPDAGSVTLAFLDRPIELQQWVITDPDHKEVRVGIFNTQFGIELDNELFKTPSRRGKG